MKHPVSGYILVWNEVGSIEASVRCLLYYCDEVLVIDGGSTDGTREKLLALVSEFGHLRLMIWPQHGPRYFGNWHEPLRRNWAAKACLHDWVLTIDADELLEEFPQDYFRGQETPLIFDTYNLLTRTEIIIRYNANGTWQDWYPDPHVRYFNRTSARYTNTPLHCYLEQEDGKHLIHKATHSGTGLFHYHAIVNPDRKWNTPENRKLLELQPLKKPLPTWDKLLKRCDEKQCEYRAKLEPTTGNEKNRQQS
jgi:glycosyltransferase involved in cell wall biosynthesis